MNAAAQRHGGGQQPAGFVEEAVQFRHGRHSLRCCRRSNGAVYRRSFGIAMEGEGTVKDEPDTLPDAERAGRTETPSTPETEWDALVCTITARYGTVLEKLGD
jgi:hypothetical protein